MSKLMVAVLLMVTVACGSTTDPMEAPMTGVVFFNTLELEELTEFYTERVGAELWMDQTDCRIFRHGQFLFGFCQREKSETCGMLTFVYPDRDGVDRMYDLFREEALDAPRENPRYPIYNFFARDPEGRNIEFQFFTGDLDWSFTRSP